jgi:phage gpG-like protein
MSFSVDFDKEKTRKLQKNLGKLKKEVANRKIMDLVLLKVKNNILLRTNAGKDINFNSFRPYSAKYASAEGKTLVSLTKTGTMLNAMTQKALSGTRGVVFFNNYGYKNTSLRVHDLVRIHNNGEGKMPKREFFGVSSQDNKDAVKIYQKNIAKAIKKVSR